MIHHIRVQELIELVVPYLPITEYLSQHFSMPIDSHHCISKYAGFASANVIKDACDLVNRVRNQFDCSVQHPCMNGTPIDQLQRLQKSFLHGTIRQFAEALISMEPEAKLIHIPNGNYWLCFWQDLWLDPWYGRVFPKAVQNKKLKTMWSFVICNHGKRTIYNVLESFQPIYHCLQECES